MPNPTESNPWAPPESARPSPPAPGLNYRALGMALLLAFAWLAPEFVPDGWASTARWAAIVGLLVLMSIALPLSIRRKQWIAAESAYEPFDPTGPDAPPGVARFFEVEGAELAAQGFDLVAMRRNAGSVANATGYVALHRHPRTLEVFKTIAAEVRTSLGTRITPTMLATSVFADGTTIATSNRTTPRVYPNFPPPFRGATFPEITDATRLVAAHRARVAEEAGGLIPVDPLGGGAEEALRKDHRRLTDHLLALGYVRPDEANGRFVYTWKGATLVVGNLLPWIKRARLAAERRRARRHLARLGLRDGRGPAATTTSG